MTAENRGGPECAICGNDKGHTFHTFHDLHFRKAGEFGYFQCGACGCLQNAKPLADWSAYYPDNYYSFTADDGTTVSSRMKWRLRETRNRYYRTEHGALGKMIHRILPDSAIAVFYSLAPSKEWRILDVGCGNSALFLQHLAREGYANILGVDPYIPVPQRPIGRGRIVRMSVAEVTGAFDLITFHHSFEHIPDQRETLLHCRELLAPDGTLLLRIPTTDSEAWRRDGEYWANLDAPRHLFLHSEKSIGVLGDRCGLTTRRIVHDSNGFQFWGAALYRRGIPLGGTASPLIAATRLAFRLYYSLRMAKRVERLNAASAGDSIAVFMRAAR